MEDKKLRNTFNDDSDFFKSTELAENGKLLLKAIPTVEKKTITKKVTVTTGKQPTKQVIAFKKKIEDAFAVVNSAVKDIAAADLKNYQQEDFVEMAAAYKKFKQKFGYLVNDLINYPNPPQQEGPAEESEWDKTRIKI